MAQSPTPDTPKPGLADWPVPEKTPRQIKSIERGRGVHFGLMGIASLILGFGSLVFGVAWPLLRNQPGWLCLSLPGSVFLFVMLFEQSQARRKRRRFLEEAPAVVGTLHLANPMLGPSRKGMWHSLHTQSGPPIFQQQIFGPFRLDDAHLSRINVGDQVKALVDFNAPASPPVIPGLEEIHFVTVEDNRPERLNPPPLRDEDAPPERSLILPLSGSKGGRLELDQESLTLHLPQVGATRIDWSEPFVVQPSVWLTSATHTELTLTLRPSGLQAKEGAIRVQAEVPQSWVERSVPMQQLQAAHLTTGGMKRLWRTVRWLQAAQGEQSRQVDPTASPLSVRQKPSLATGGQWALWAWCLMCVLGASLVGYAVHQFSPEVRYAEHCRQGMTSRCTDLAHLYLGGASVDRDLERALHFTRMACEQKDTSACLRFAEASSSDVHQEVWAQACFLGSSEACYRHGMALSRTQGKGRASDIKRSIGFLKRGCDLDDAVACLQLGRVWRKGELVEQDYKEAVRFYAQACNQGNLAGCCELAELHIQGKGPRPGDVCQIPMLEACPAVRKRCR